VRGPVRNNNFASPELAHADVECIASFEGQDECSGAGSKSERAEVDLCRVPMGRGAATIRLVASLGLLTEVLRRFAAALDNPQGEDGRLPELKQF